MSMNTGCAVSNAFDVKDIEAFREDLKGLTQPIEVVPRSEGSNNVFIFSRSGFWPDSRYGEDDGSEVDIDFIGLVAKHLVEGQRAVLTGVSSERPEELWFTHWVVNSKGESIINDVDTVTEMALAAMDEKEGKGPNHVGG